MVAFAADRAGNRISSVETIDGRERRTMGRCLGSPALPEKVRPPEERGPGGGTGVIRQPQRGKDA